MARPKHLFLRLKYFRNLTASRVADMMTILRSLCFFLATPLSKPIRMAVESVRS